jgi:hypothetical protein
MRFSWPNCLCDVGKRCCLRLQEIQLGCQRESLYLVPGKLRGTGFRIPGDNPEKPSARDALTLIVVVLWRDCRNDKRSYTEHAQQDQGATSTGAKVHGPKKYPHNFSHRLGRLENNCEGRKTTKDRMRRFIFPKSHYVKPLRGRSHRAILFSRKTFLTEGAAQSPECADRPSRLMGYETEKTK